MAEDVASPTYERLTRPNARPNARMDRSDERPERRLDLADA